jgi:PAS domain S-box-containing protein
MKDEDKTKQQLINELLDLRRQTAKVKEIESECRRLKRERDRIETRLRTIIESLPFDFFGLDATGRYFIQNSSIRAAWGNLLGKKPENLGVDKDTLALWLSNNRRAFSGEVVKGEVEFTRGGEKRYFYNIIAPIYDKGQIDGILGFNIDITDLKKIEGDLKEREKELQTETHNLEEVNTALRVLLKRVDEDKTEIEEKVLLNVKEMVIPYVKKLRNSGLNERQKTYLDILESSLNQIISPFSLRMSSSFLNFTPRELQVANLLREGRTNKEIGELLNSSPRTVACHRESIRKKLGLKNKKVNLKSYLLSIK